MGGGSNAPNGGEMSGDTLLDRVHDLESGNASDYYDMVSSLFSGDNGGTPSLLRTPNTNLGPSPYYTAILTEYKLNVHHYVPVLPSDEGDLERAIRTAPPFLMSAILTITFPDTNGEIDTSIVNPTLTDIQAVLLLSIAYSGKAEYHTGQAILSRACAHLITMEPKLREMEEKEAKGDTTVDVSTLDLWRRVWWECWCYEIFTAATTRATNMILLGKTGYRPKFPRKLMPSVAFVGFLGVIFYKLLKKVQAATDDLFTQASALMYETMTIDGDHINVENLTHLTNIGSNIFALARQEWDSAVSAPAHLQTQLKLSVARERSLYAALLASATVVVLHTTVFAFIMHDTGEDLVPPPGTNKYLKEFCSTAFDFLRKATSYYSSPEFARSTREVSSGPMTAKPPKRSPFFACTQRHLANGAFFAFSRSRLTRQIEDLELELERVDSETNFQLAERLIRQDSAKWPHSLAKADQIKILREQLNQVH